MGYLSNGLRKYAHHVTAVAGDDLLCAQQAGEAGGGGAQSIEGAGPGVEVFGARISVFENAADDHTEKSNFVGKSVRQGRV